MNVSMDSFSGVRLWVLRRWRSAVRGVRLISSAYWKWGMVRDRVMVLNIWLWIGVRVRGVSICGSSAAAEVREGCGRDEAGDSVVSESRAAANLCTSSFITRPSFPVPVTCAISTFSSLSRPRTAGVANAACLPNSFDS